MAAAKSDVVECCDTRREMTLFHYTIVRVTKSTFSRNEVPDVTIWLRNERSDVNIPITYCPWCGTKLEVV